MVKKTIFNKFKAVILAGGSGERFWPLSTSEKPKQFLKVFGGDSLIRQSVNRLAGMVAPQDVFVVTSKDLTAATIRELPELPNGNVVGEPLRRDTGAAIALGVGLAGRDDDIIGFFSSDQMVSDVKKFHRALAKAIKIAAQKDAIVTLGIKPSYAATCFGYVNPATGRFIEKPTARKAAHYLLKGYLWNAGMFIARASVFRAAFATHAPSLSALAQGSFKTTRLKSVYEQLEKISFDYAVMEKLSRVEVVKGDFGWDDVGSYAAFDKYFPHDSRGNVREGPVTVVEAADNICIARSARISLLGVSNLVVVTTPDAVLVADKGRLSDMKKLFGK